MKHFRTLLLVAAAALMATSCDVETPEDDLQGARISVSAQMYGFTKATDTAFEEGDKIGLHIVTNAAYLDNALYTYQNGKLQAATENFWYQDKELEADIVAYHPYSADAAYGLGTLDFTVNADQSTEAGYKGSDLLLANTSSKPTEATITLPFKHALSKVVVNIDNQLDEQIANVWFSDIYGSVDVDLLAGEATAKGSTGTIRAAKVADNSWTLIVAPQAEVLPKLIVTTASEKQYTFALAEAVSFSAGKVATATITLTPESIATDFTPTISDWVDDNDLNFNQTEEGEEGDIVTPEPEYQTLYFVPNSNWLQDAPRFAAYLFNDSGNTWVDLTLVKDNVYSVVPPAGYANIIFCRMDPANTTNIWNNKWNQTADLVIPTENNSIFVLPKGAWNGANGDWTIYDPEATYGESEDEGDEGESSEVSWGIVGSITSWGGTADIALVLDEALGLYVAQDVEIPAGAAIKVRGNNEWNDAYNYGAEVAGNAEINTAITLICGGGSKDITIATAGTYDIYFDLAGSKLYIMEDGQVPAL